MSVLKYKAGEKWLLCAMLVISLVTSVMAGVRSPGLWSYSYFLFNYDYGFIKRGLIGGLIEQVDILFLYSYEFYFYSSFVVFLLILIKMLQFSWRSIESQDRVLLLSILVFFTSSSVVFLSHSVGSLDLLGLAIVLVSFGVEGFYRKLLYIVIFAPLALMAHEAFLILYYPVLFITLLLCVDKGKGRQQYAVMVVLSIVTIVSVYYLNNSLIDKQSADAMYEKLLNKASAELMEKAFEVLYQDMNYFQGIMSELRDNPLYLKASLYSLIVAAPSIILFIYLSSRLLKEAGYKRHIVILAVLASISPLVLHVFAYDMHRWNMLAVLTSFLVLMAISMQTKSIINIKRWHVFTPIVVVIITFNLITEIPLFDGYKVKRFPYTEHQQYLLDVYRGEAEFPYVPTIEDYYRALSERGIR